MMHVSDVEEKWLEKLDEKWRKEAELESKESEDDELLPAQDSSVINDGEDRPDAEVHDETPQRAISTRGRRRRFSLTL